MPDQHSVWVADRFKHHLNTIVVSEKLFGCLEVTAAAFDIDGLVDTVLSNFTDVEAFVHSVSTAEIEKQLAPFPGAGRMPGRRLVVAPCSPLFADILETLGRTFDNILFIDAARWGVQVAGHPIVAPQDVESRPDDLCLIMTRNTEAADCYEKMFAGRVCLNLLKFYNRKKPGGSTPLTTPFIEQVNASAKPVLVSSPRPLGTLTSTVRQLAQDGFDLFWFGSEEVKEEHQTGYATPKISDLRLRDYAIGGFIDLLQVFTRMMHGTILFHFEALYPPAWDFQRVAICYAGALAVIRTVKECREPNSTSRLALYMYDAIKPGVRNYPAGESCGRLYRMMMLEAEAVVFSSYTKEFGDFVENAIGRSISRVHTHRYQIVPSKRQKRLTNGYHIAVISVLLEEFWEPSRMGLVPYIRNIIAQGIHIDYYVGHSSLPKIEIFKESLPESQRRLFHIHAPIHDPERLAYDLSCFHAGWSLFNMQIFNDMTTNLTDPFYRDAMDLFTPTTLPSVIWSCAAAGLPVICNRSMRGVVGMLPEHLTVPLSLSELSHLRNILDRLDWKAIDRIPLDDLDISRQSYQLNAFLEGHDDNLTSSP